MKSTIVRHLFPAGLALAVMMPAMGQQSSKSPSKEKKEITITEKGKSGEKMTIVVDGDRVTINGKPISEYDGGNVIIRKRDMERAERELERDMERMGRDLERLEHAMPYAFEFQPSPMPRVYGVPEANLWRELERGDAKPKARLGVVTERHDKGVRILEVMEGSAAIKAGLKEGDIITAVDGKKTTDSEVLTELIRAHQPGDETEITYLRDGKSKKIKLALGSTGTSARSFSYSMPRVNRAPREEFRFNFPDMGEYHSWNSEQPRLGLKIEDTEASNGVKILYVEEGSAAEKSGLKKDDIITHMAGATIKDTREAREIIRVNRDKSVLPITVSRNGSPYNVEVRFPKKLQKADL